MQERHPDMDFNERWVRHQRQSAKTTRSWACIFCADRKIFSTGHEIWEHASSDHADQIPRDSEARAAFQTTFESQCAQNKSKPKDDVQRTPKLNKDNSTQSEPREPPKRSLSGLGVAALGLDVADLSFGVASNQEESPEGPRKRAVIGDGISARSMRPYRESSSSPPPRRSKARPASDLPDIRNSDMFDMQRPHDGKLWGERGGPSPRPAFVDPKNIASVEAQKQRLQALQPKTKRSFQSLKSPQYPNLRQSPQSPQAPKEGTYDIILQPETRPISQEQLVAEVKGIYAGLVMVEAKCIEVDRKQASLSQTDTVGHPKLNNEQWQALIALHRTLLHEHHDFFLASQHSSASPALRRRKFKKQGTHFAIRKSFLVHLALMSQLTCVDAAPVSAGKTEVFIALWEDFWTGFVEGWAGPLITILVQSFVLLLLYKTIVWCDCYDKKLSVETDLEVNLDEPKEVRPKDSYALLCSQVILPYSVFLLGRDDRVPSYTLVPLWLFAFGLSVKFLQLRLLLYAKSAGQIYVFIMTLAIGSATMFVHRSAPIEGRYADQLIYTTFAFLPAFAYYAAGWVAIVHNSGRAKIIEDTFYLDSRTPNKRSKMKFNPSPVLEHIDSEVSIVGKRPRNRRRMTSRKYALSQIDRRPTMPMSTKRSVTKVQKNELIINSNTENDNSITSTEDSLLPPEQSLIRDIACNIVSDFITQ